MELKEWEEKYKALIDERIDDYTVDHEDEIVKPDALQSKELQLESFKHKIQESLQSKDQSDQMQHALKILSQQMPHYVSKETWDAINEEFCNCEANLLNYLEENKEPTVDDFVPIYEMCGFTVPTLVHCYEFGQSLYNKESYEDARAVMRFLMYLSPLMPEFWIAAAMCEKQLGNYLDAIRLYQLALTLFPDQVSLHLYCADNYIQIGDKLHAQLALEAAKKNLDANPQGQAQWGATYEFLLDKVK